LTGTPGNQQEQSDLLFHARKITSLLLIRSAYRPTPRRAAGTRCLRL
jgi:hypothetical protein